MSDAKAIKRQLTIKTGVVKRLVKEQASYHKEAQEQEERVKKYESEGKEEWEIKQQKKVLIDCQQMIPDCQKRLQSAIEDLQSILDGLQQDEEEEIISSEEVKTAKEILTTASAASVETK